MSLFRKLKKFLTQENPVKEVLEHSQVASLESLEAALIASDVSGDLAQKICEGLSLKKPLREQVLAVIQKKLAHGETSWDVKPGQVVLLAGVNGSGKTTTVGKMAARFSDQGLKVVLCGADSFRDGAADQLALWGESLP